MELQWSSEMEAVWAWIQQDSPDAVSAALLGPTLQSVTVVAQTVQQFAPHDPEMVTAAMLYSYQQRSGSPIPDTLKELLAEVVMTLVEGSAEMSALHGAAFEDENKSDSHHENLRKMLLAMARDVRVVVIKLAEQLERMRVPGDSDMEKRREDALLTRNVLAPLANRLGMGALKWQLEDIAFRVLDPETYMQLSEQVELKRSDRDHYIQQSVAAIREALAGVGIEGEVSGRTKHLYSIWKKMVRKQVSVEELYDLHAVRILVETIADCYSALGVVHGLWNHIPKEFDDYIASPKGNNYRSIHTAVYGPEGRVLEVQIRTREMHEAAELGVASHWRYKEGTRYDPGFERKIEWLRQLLDWKEELSGQEGISEQFQDEMAEEQIYLLTPAGEVVELPEGGTALDFAYSIHTGLGHRTRGAKVDGVIVPLHQPLHSGQRVEILTVKEGSPTRDWLNPNLGYLRTSRARYRVRQWFRRQDFGENVAAGRTIVERERVRAGATAISMDQLVLRFGQKDQESFYAAVGQGDITTGQIAGAFEHLRSPEKESQPRKRPRKEREAEQTPEEITIRGVGKLLTNMANCCKPDYPDRIIGFITRSRGVTIHQQECPNALHLIETEPERVIEVSWSGEELEQRQYALRIEAYDRAGLLRDITLLLSSESANIDSVQTTTDKENHIAHIALNVELDTSNSIGRVLDQLLRMRNIITARADQRGM